MAYTRGEIAGFYYLALRLGRLPKEAPTRWADAEVLCATVPDSDMIDLSLAVNRPVDEVLTILSRMRKLGSLAPSKLLASLLARQIAAQTLSELEAARVLYALHNLDAAADDALGPQICCIDDLFEPYNEGPPDAPAEYVRKFLKPYEPLELPPV